MSTTSSAAFCAAASIAESRVHHLDAEVLRTLVRVAAARQAVAAATAALMASRARGDTGKLLMPWISRAKFRTIELRKAIKAAERARRCRAAAVRPPMRMAARRATVRIASRVSVGMRVTRGAAAKARLR